MGHQYILGIFIFSYSLTSSSSWNGGSRLPDLYWNSSNPIFHISNTDHIMDVVQGGSPAPKINIICPHYPWKEEEEQEQHVIYSVEKEEFETCRILRPQPRIIAKCTEPSKKKVFTFSFRSFSPIPGGIEFLPGQDYYFISTSGPSDVQSRVGGFCQSHNMKVVFKVLDPEMVAAAVESERKAGEVIRINTEIKPILVSTKKSETTTTTTTVRSEGERIRKRKRKEKEARLRSTTKPSELQKFLAKRGFSSSSSRGFPLSQKTLFFLFLIPNIHHITQLFPVR